MDRLPAQRVEVVVSARTLLVLLGVGAIVALVLLSLGTLLSVVVAAVLALGLDPVVGALVRRGWVAAGQRSRSSPGCSRPSS
jgi:predicted PurR-regulated permease PerM